MGVMIPETTRFDETPGAREGRDRDRFLHGGEPERASGDIWKPAHATGIVARLGALRKALMDAADAMDADAARRIEYAKMAVSPMGTGTESVTHGD